MSKKTDDFINKMYPVLQKVCTDRIDNNLPITLVSIGIAQSAIETGWGTSKIFVEKGNAFGMRAYDSSPYESATNYDSLYESCFDYMDVLCNEGYYDGMINNFDVYDAVHYLNDYATSRDYNNNGIKDYIEDIITIIDNYNLKYYDECVIEYFNNHYTCVSTREEKSIDELASEVIDGMWGNGDERKSKLSEHGYDYESVQNKVNELLSNEPIPESAPIDNYRIHVVESGESFWSIAECELGDGNRYMEIVDINGLCATSPIFAGQILHIPS